MEQRGDLGRRRLLNLMGFQEYQEFLQRTFIPNIVIQVNLRALGHISVV